MTAGRLLLGIRQKFGRGLRVAWYRDVVRPRILRTSPVTGNTDHTAEIHVLTSNSDWLNLIWALKSFYAASQRHYALCIHDDGSLGAEQSSALARHFPDARIILRRQADSDVFPALASYPRCLRFRQTNHLAPKVFDFAHYLKSDRMLLLDSDVLFFREPAELLKRAEDMSYTKNCFNADDESSYTITPEVARDVLKINLIERFNSGLGLIHRDSLRREWLEEFLAVPGLADGHFWRIEQTLFALCSSKFGVELLPDEYRVHLGKGFGQSPCRHYVGAVRHLFYGEGIGHLSQNRRLFF